MRDLLQAEQLSAAKAGLSEARPISLDFRDTPIRTVLDLVSRHSGVNFVFDKDIRQDLRLSVYLRQVKVEEALDLLVSTHQLAKKVLDERTVLIYPNTPDKQREYQEQVVRVFHLSSGEAKQAAAMLRAALKVRDPFIDERTNMLMLRESPETMQIAERLLALYDTAEPEVTLEVEVLEISSNRLTELGVKFPDTISLTPLTASGGAVGHTLSTLRDLNSDRIGVSVSGLLLNLRREVGDFETLANPRIRIKNKEKGKVLIGTKVPVVTTTATTGFIAENVTYLDVGLKLGRVAHRGGGRRGVDQGGGGGQFAVEFTAELVGKTDVPVRGMNIVLAAQPSQTALVKGEEGDWWRQGESDANVTQAQDPQDGQWRFGVIRRVAQGAQAEGTPRALRDP